MGKKQNKIPPKNLKEMKKLEKSFLLKAEELADCDKYIFLNLFVSFKTHIDIMEGLQKSILEDGAVIEKEYVKNRPALTANPAITQYNATSKAATTVAGALNKILEKVADVSGSLSEPNILNKLRN